MVSSVRENRWRIWQMYEISAFIWILIPMKNIAWDDSIFILTLLCVCFLALPFREERLRVNAKMLDIYLTPLQMRRFKVFTRLLDGDAKPIDVYTLIVSANDSNRHLIFFCFFAFERKSNLFFSAIFVWISDWSCGWCSGKWNNSNFRDIHFDGWNSQAIGHTGDHSMQTTISGLFGKYRTYCSRDRAKFTNEILLSASASAVALIIVELN